MAHNPKIAVRGAGLGGNATAREVIAARQGSRLKAFRPHLGPVFLNKEVGATAIGVYRRDVAGEGPELMGGSSVIYNSDVIDVKLIISCHATDGFGTDVEAMSVRDTRHATSMAFAGAPSDPARVHRFLPGSHGEQDAGCPPGHGLLMSPRRARARLALWLAALLVPDGVAVPGKAWLVRAMA